MYMYSRVHGVDVTQLSSTRSVRVQEELTTGEIIETEQRQGEVNIYSSACQLQIASHGIMATTKL